MPKIYPWRKYAEQIKKIYENCNSYHELQLRLTKFFDELKKKGEIPENALDNVLYNAVDMFARRHGWRKPHHQIQAPYRTWDAECLAKFTQRYLAGATREELMQEFRGLKTASIVNHAVQHLIPPEIRKKRVRKFSEKKEKGKKVVPKPEFEKREWPEPPILEMSREAFEKPGARPGAFSRIEWKDKGARTTLIKLAYEQVFVPRGCHYVVLNGGLVSKRDVEARIEKELQLLTADQRKLYKREVVEHVLQEMANELCSVIPKVKIPEDDPTKKPKFLKLYVMTSPILDGEYGERIAQLLYNKRPDIIPYKPGGDRTRLKGVGKTPEEKRRGGKIAWLNPRKHRLPGQYVSTAVDKEVSEEEASTDSFPTAWGVAGFGASMAKPGGGEKKRPYFSLPVLHVPTPRRQGEPSSTLNQIGVRVIEVSPDGERIAFESWSFRDLLTEERKYVAEKEDMTELQKQIVSALKEEKRGLTIGELYDILEKPREEIEKAAEELLETKFLKRKWPGLYKDESGRYNFHLDWFQDYLKLPWDYDKGYVELRRLLAGCFHAGYTTTDYEYICREWVKIILEENINVLEIIGDLVAGLKHNLIHRGQIIGNMNYSDQEIFAGELVATVIYNVFVARFEKKMAEKKEKLSPEELAEVVKSCLILFLYITGNHDSWQKDFGVTPGLVFRAAIMDVLNRYITQFLRSKHLNLSSLDEILRSKIIELSGDNPTYTFEGGISTHLLHPSMARTKTTSIRCEEALGFTETQMVDVANFHTAVEVERWDPNIGSRVATQVGAMLIQTDFESSKMKRVDFGPVYITTRSKNGRIFYVRTEFFNKPILRKPISKKTNVDDIKDRLGILRSQFS
jgi:hypothetical protein